MSVGWTCQLQMRFCDATAYRVKWKKAQGRLSGKKGGALRLGGNIAIVTGAGQGIGRAIALALAEEGAEVALVGRTEDKLRAVGSEIEALGRGALPVVADVTIRQQVDSAVQAVMQRFGRVDILVNNAGLAMASAAVDFAEADWDRLFAINAKAPFLCSQAVARQMIGKGGGCIVNIAGLSAHIGASGHAGGSASKGALIMLTKALAVEWARHNIRVNAVSPGFTLTPLGEKIAREEPEVFRERARRTPLGRLGTTDDVARVVADLCSPSFSFVTGQVIMLDGGLLSLHPGYVDAAPSTDTD